MAPVTGQVDDTREIASVEPSILRLLGDVFPTKERLRLVAVILGAVFSALFEVVGVASIVPFMAVVMDPSALDRYGVLRDVTVFLGGGNDRERLVILGVLTGTMIFASNAVNAIALRTQLGFVARTRRRLSRSLFDAYLAQPYEFHVRRDAPSLLSVIYADTEAVNGLVGSVLQLVARSLVIIALLAVLIAQNPMVAIWTLTVLGGGYGVIYAMVRKRQGQIGMQWAEAQRARQRAAQEGLGGIKELLVLGREAEASRRFSEATDRISSTTARSEWTKAIPRYLLEPIAFGGILAATLAMILAGDEGSAQAIPTLALYAFVGYRLLPALQTIFANAVSIKYSTPSLRSLHSDWLTTAAVRQRRFPVPAPPAERFVSDAALLKLDGIVFRYPTAAKRALDHVRLEIRHGESIGLVGRSGSGKTTLADLMLGLYEPQEGSILADGEALHQSNLRSWRGRVGYVPQSVYLANASISENIAFGLAAENIDSSAVRDAARLAQAEEFINALPEGLDTVVGERGVKLSGGQRQRLGIARALYNTPDLLIFDEATSALDGMTEEAVMEAIHALSGSRTVVLIAHRLSTVRACDRIILLEAGRVVCSGSYDHLMRVSPEFRRLAGAPETQDQPPEGNLTLHDNGRTAKLESR